jgi:hypothetical protein
MNTDLFGRPFVDPFKSDQLPLFHEPISVKRPDPVRIGSKSANDPKNTLPLPLSGQKADAT